MILDRKIKYIEYLDGTERLGIVGFVRITLTDNDCMLDLKVSGLCDTDSFQTVVYAGKEGWEGKLSQLDLHKGVGELHLLMPKGAIDVNQGVKADELTYVRIPLDDRRTLFCRIQKDEEIKVSSKEGAVNREADEIGEKIPKAEPIPKEELPYASIKGESTEELDKPEDIADSLEKSDRLEECKEQQGGEADRLEECKEQQGGEPDRKASKSMAEMSLGETKWEYLVKIYEHVRPFQDGREYLLIGLSDFLIFSIQSYQLVHNSFLLHGFYNYHHLILHRRVRGRQAEYFVGVPGLFYEKEKQVARIYGFESFEGKGDYAKEGEFGYYMIRVRL